MQQLQNQIIKLIQGIKDEKKLKLIYHFIRGMLSGR